MEIWVVLFPLRFVNQVIKLRWPYNSSKDFLALELQDLGIYKGIFIMHYYNLWPVITVDRLVFK